MKKLILSLICCGFLTFIYGQDAQKLHEEGLEKAEDGQLEKAIKLFDKSIKINPNEYIVWYNRGIAKSMLDKYDEALADFEQTLILYPDYKKAYLNRGTAKKYLFDYKGSLSDYSYAITLDKNYIDAYYNRGLLYEMLNKKDSSCIDFTKALELGMTSAQGKVNKCNDTTQQETHSIIKLTKTAENETYGFTSENPILVGVGPNGGPANQKAYLNLLRDINGNPIKYERMGSCCAYPSDNGFLGMAMLDKYEITYLNEKKQSTKTIVYISFYDYEEPQILFGFKTVGQK